MDVTVLLTFPTRIGWLLTQLSSQLVGCFDNPLN
jgi:hypothetical protein